MTQQAEAIRQLKGGSCPQETSSVESHDQQLIAQPQMDSQQHEAGELFNSMVRADLELNKMKPKTETFESPSSLLLLLEDKTASRDSLTKTTRTEGSKL